MDVDLEPLNSQDNVEDCMMTGVEENVNCTCDCGGTSTYKLYVRYARCLGFGVHKGDTARGKDGTQCRRMFFCSKEGKRAEKYISSLSRKREHRALTRTGCEVMLAVYLDTKTSTWRVKKLVETHNHDLGPQCLVHLIPNHRGLIEPQKAQANTMHDHGLSISIIMGLMVGQASGYANVGFTKKDLDNHFQRTRRVKLIGRDSNATISYLLGKADVDSMAMARYSATDEGRLDKRMATYTWLLQNFLEVMLNKSPSVVVTDGDEAMKAAIREIFPDVTH
ncbi:protein FAR1-RELATED SEQUENCE 11-like [Arachis duranensis]|uniref:Protein FAR1-RELATED SEQUENCE 11-like n=1 Tax=Arachis duranensis TaxID=130453 RepID=A0A9C6WUZ2_ARADU|nr:protein FAR1-RELATED SEQUENCE 11-like [Arachis duranensis]